MPPCPALQHIKVAKHGAGGIAKLCMQTMTLDIITNFELGIRFWKTFTLEKYLTLEYIPRAKLFQQNLISLAYSH